jgi:hypothetical protein
MNGALALAQLPPTAAVEWQRAFRDMEARYETWIKRFRCQADRLIDHPRPRVDEHPREDWAALVQTDVDERNARQIEAGLGDAP